MDPDANLSELRTLVADNLDREFVSDHVANRVMVLVDAIDTWISQGGFLPTEWRP